MEPKQKNIWSLIAGIVFIALGSYRLYDHFIVNELNDFALRQIVAVALIGYGMFRCYGYLKQ